MINAVTSKDNKVLKLVRSLHNKKGRLQSCLYFAEGVRLVKEALNFANDKIEFLIISETYQKQNTEFLSGLDKIIYVTPDKNFAEICDTETPQGIGAVLKMPAKSTPDFNKMNYVLCLDGVSEPGNMGTIIRTAEAAGIDSICLLNDCVDIYSPKVVRSAMGSVFRMNFVFGSSEIITNLKEADFTVLATALYNSEPIEETTVIGKRAIVIGNEAHGVSEEIIGLCDKSVRIDMKGSVESLNAAVAAGITMYILKV